MDGDGNSDQQLETLNIVLVGDTGVGKTNLLISYATDEFRMEHVPTVFDHYSLEIDVRGHPMKVEAWDQSGRDEHLNLRKFAYGKAQAIVICFHKHTPATFKSVQTKWLPEIRKDDKLKAIPLILVATKCDQFEDQDLFNSRSDSDMNLGLPGGTEGNLNEKKEGDAPAGDAKSSSVSKETAESIAQFEGLTKYVETSSLFGEGVKNVFDEAIHAILKDQSKYNKEMLAGLKDGIQKGKKGGGPDGDKKCLIF
ncbi:hypothetical protein FGO68_gene3684 [Halteria grandinella]|uniref:Uncharacterized protein n=1 Tax=Halteria grandinella TaxID=5974 RepID=A0A8J8SYY0_HALGN|nr:hypothetical protein FGO68_gene3684 [Halteria grandinella]